MRLTWIVAATLAAAACKRQEGPAWPKPSPQAPAAAASGEAAPAAPRAAAPAAGAGVLRGKIVERIDVPQYSYLRLSTASGDVWAAVERTERKPGDEVAVANPLPMQGFESKELKRKFDVVYFGSLAAPGAEALGGLPAAPDPHAGGAAMGVSTEPAAMAAQHRAAVSGPAGVKVTKVPRAPGPDGRTVEEVWAQRGDLKGKTVSVRGTIVKSTPVMGRVFLHLRDGSGSEEKKTNDLTVTTGESAAVGEVVVARGTVALDRDMGAGYAYPVLVEGAKVSR
jgi:hypothetical protein